MFGKSRQGYYKQSKKAEKITLNEQIVLEGVRAIRKKAKTERWGVRKLHYLLNEELQCVNIKIGRDKLFDLLRENNMLVRKRKRKFFTTNSHHWLRKYDNLIVNKSITTPNQLWVSDITYIKISDDKALYLYLITDAYSQKIVGWSLSDDLKADSAVVALEMAIKNNKGKFLNLIHHSDRGVQYCSHKYVERLNKNNVRISMTSPGSPQENAIAERLNGILKEEWLNDLNRKSLSSGRTELNEIIVIYNTYRPHQSLKYDTPENIHDNGFSRNETERVVGKMYEY